MPTRLDLEVGVSYAASPAAVKQAMQDAMAQSPHVLPTPAPDVLLVGFDASSMNYRARFWVDDYERDEEARDEVRVAIHYVFARRGIEIPYPIQVEYSRDWPAPDAAALAAERRAGDRRRRSVLDAVGPAARRSRERHGSDDLRKRRSDRPAGRAWRIDVRAVLGTVAVVLEPGQERGRDHRSGWLFRRDVAADRRAEVGDGRGPRRSGRSRADRGGIPAPRREQPARHRAGGARGDYAAGRARPREVFRAGHGRRRGPRDIPRADEEIPAPVRESACQ